MNNETILIHGPSVGAPEVALRQLREAGVEWGFEQRDAKPGSRAKARRHRRSRLREVAARAMAASQSDSQKKHAAWVLDNLHLLLASEREAREFALTLSTFPAVTDSSGVAAPRVCLLARKYLETADYCFHESVLIT